MNKMKALLTVCLILISSACFAATYTSTQTGNWNTDATWGGGGHPSANDDIVNIAASHIVTYDAGDSAVTWGNVTVTGTLTFPVNANSTMSFSTTGVLAVAATGVLNAGTSTSAPIGAAYHCRIYWPQGATGRNVFTAANGATVNGYGDPAFYGSTPTADLHDDWSSTQTLYVTGDYTAKWAAGQKFWIHKNAYASWSTDAHIFTIASIGAYDSGNNRTPITITEAAPGVLYDAVNATSGWTSKLVMISRNVEIEDPGSKADVYGYNPYTENIRISFSQSDPNALLNFNNCLFEGWAYMLLGYNVVFNGSVFLNNSVCQTTGSVNSIVRNSVSCSNSTVNGSVYGASISDSYFVSNGAVAALAHACKIATSNFIGNNLADGFGIKSEINNCKFLYNVIALNASWSQLVKNSDFWLNNSTVQIQSATLLNQFALENCEMEGVKRALRVYEKVGNFLPLVSGDSHWQTPDSGNSWILEATPASYIGTGDFNKMIMSPHKEMAVYCPAGSNTLTFKIYPHGWTTDLTNADVYIKIRYLTDTGNETAEAQTTTATFDDDAWRSMSVTFTTGQAGVAYFNVYMTKYEASAYFLLDPVWTLS